MTKLVLYAGFAQGWRARGKPIEIETGEALQTLVQGGWGRSHPAFRQVFTSLFFPCRPSCCTRVTTGSSREEGMKLATGIPGARFVPLESRNHLLLEGEPAWQRLLEEVRRFLGSEG